MRACPRANCWPSSIERSRPMGSNSTHAAPPLLNPRSLTGEEPTSVLTPQEVQQLFETLRKLAASGCSILYISHKLHEIVALCDTATILRGGKVVAHCDPKRETSRSMAEMMIGANLKEIAKPLRRGLGPSKLSSRGLNLP